MRGAGSWLGFAVFVLWVSAVVTPGLIWLSRGECVASSSRPAVAEGGSWTLRHHLPTGHPFTSTLVSHLVAHPPVSGFTTEVVLHGPAPTLRQRLQAAGWRVTEADRPPRSPDEPASPWLEVRDSRQARVWSGVYRPSDLADPGAMILETTLLAALARGDTVAPYVPIGCGPGEARPGRTLATLFNRSP